MKATGYALDEAVLSLRRGGRSALMSIATIAVAFLTLGGFVLVSANLQSLVARWASAAEMSVYLAATVTEATRTALASELAGQRGVAAVEYVTADEARSRFRSDFPELADLADAEPNPFPAALEVRLHNDAAAAGAAEAIAGQMAGRPGIADVRYDRLWLTRLLAVTNIVRTAGLVCAGVLVLGAAFTVAAVVRLSLLARRAELEIMELVGAPLGFIRGPFVAEGTLLGGAGAALALLLLWGLFLALGDRVQELAAGFASIGQVRFLGLVQAVALIGAGVVVGALAGAVAARGTTPS